MLFEVGMCVMIYLTVLYIEFVPIVVERFKGRVDLPGVLTALNRPIEGLLAVADGTLSRFISCSSSPASCCRACTSRRWAP